MRAPVWRGSAVAWHTALALVVSVVALLAVSVGVVVFAGQETDRAAERTAQQVSSAVVGPISARDFSPPVGREVAAVVADDLRPFFASGIVTRVKIWSVDAGHATIVYSDEPRLVGETIPLDPAADVLSGGAPRVQEVPDDAEHRYEAGQAHSLREVFTSFRDASGTPRLLELYVHGDEEATIRDTALPVLAAGAVGLLVLSFATVPLSLAIARRFERGRDAQREARDYGLSAAEDVRQEVSQRLHDGVIPDLAGVGLLLEAERSEVRACGGEPSALVEDAHALLAEELDRLRALLDDIAPRPPVGGLRTALDSLVGRLARPASVSASVTVDLDRPLPADVESTLYRVAHELIRNAVRHSGAGAIAVRVGSTAHDVHLVVSDDGAGFDPDPPVEPGHVGLLLVRRAVSDRGGVVEIDTAAGRGTSVAVRLPTPGAPTGGAVRAEGLRAWRARSGSVGR